MGTLSIQSQGGVVPRVPSSRTPYDPGKCGGRPSLFPGLRASSLLVYTWSRSRDGTSLVPKHYFLSSRTQRNTGTPPTPPRPSSAPPQGVTGGQLTSRACALRPRCEPGVYQRDVEDSGIRDRHRSQVNPTAPSGRSPSSAGTLVLVGRVEDSLLPSTERRAVY